MQTQPLTITSTAITPQVTNNQTQLIFQRHCNYDRNDGTLLPESKKIQKELVKAFISNLDTKGLENTYFLFAASPTQNKDFKRCLESTNIAMELIKKMYQKKNVSLDHIINLSPTSAYNNSIHESKHLTEPKMFTDETGYLEFLKDKHNGINQEFWIDFEEDQSKSTREQLNAEGPDQIVERAVHYINVLQRYAYLFHIKHPNSKLIIWNGTHYDLISPLVKQRILNLEKHDIVNVKNCGGISLRIDESDEITANINGFIYPIDSQYSKLPPQHFQK